MEENVLKERVAQLEDHILKKCLWQFHSRAWDRERQNENILGKTMQILCGEPIAKETAEDRCYYADAVCLADAYKERFDWINTLNVAEIKEVMAALKERIDYVTIIGSLNEELTVKQY
ncbi:Fe-only nitrogenase subunit delta [Paenibacillus sp. 7124]|uniref:Nitrogenase iron-iron protein delta chain n=1 Tax=Paenibacillus apii TaxID=1850370 RepID=A0A6M1PM14_9BACL|nr:Fe-only nitrogenase subunit delta [Paenibacillus apii]NGM83508.1 Fe-only nitrogenase subunit delta [Paenibacillus apii]NJJ40470.1 Fe-only nitrogenase subunit delta [Paenibacillus apii]